MVSRLLMAGQKWDDDTNAFIGGAVVRLEEDGSWTSLIETTTGAWALEEYTIDGAPALFFIDAGGDDDRPFRGTLYRSLDEGDTWLDVSPPLGFTAGHAVSADGTLWAITDEVAPPGNAGGHSRIYKSDDKGSTWTLSHDITDIGFGEFSQAHDIAAHPTDPNIIGVTGVLGRASAVRIWRTLDGGSSWSFISPTFPFFIGNIFGQLSMLFAIVADNSWVYGHQDFANADVYIFRSTDNGSTWSTYFTEAQGGNFGPRDFIEGCDTGLWYVTPQKVYRGPVDFASGPVVIADRTDPPFSASAFIFNALSCFDGQLEIGTHGVGDVTCCDPSGVWQRPIDLSTGWAEHINWASMDSDLGWRLYIWPQGVIGASSFTDRYELPCEDPAAAGDFVPQCIPILSWEISVDGQHAYFSRARAQGMGISNAGQDTAALLPNENVWAPTGAEFGDEGGTYNIRRELIVNDYGINQAAELDNLASAYLPHPDKTFKGITSIRFQVGGIPRAGSQAPIANKIIQAGDKITFACGSDKGCGIAEGDWVVDEVSYEFPRGITTVLASKRPAAHARPMVSGNIRNLGESLAAVGGVYESPWFSTSDASFLANPTREGSDSLYDTFAFEHFMGVPPRTITMVAAKNKIFDWYDEDLVIAAQPLYVPRQFIDLSQVQGVGYNVVEWGKNKIVFHFLRYLFYDDIDGAWVRPQDRFIKVWLLP